MKVIIPAAGYATRLGELTKNQPKHLLKVGSRPIIDYVIEGVDALAVDKVFLITNNKFYNHFLRWRRHLKTCLTIEILNDRTHSNEDRLGTVGDIWYAVKKWAIDDDLFIIAGDNLYYNKGFGYDLNPLYNVFEQLGRQSGVVGLYDVGSLEVARHLNQVSFAEGRTPACGEKARITKIVEKAPNPSSSLIAVMIEAYPQSVIKDLKEYISLTEDHDKMGDFRSWLLKEERVPFYGYNLPGQWFDIGLLEHLRKARMFYNSL